MLQFQQRENQRGRPEVRGATLPAGWKRTGRSEVNSNGFLPLFIVAPEGVWSLCSFVRLARYLALNRREMPERRIIRPSGATPCSRNAPNGLKKKRPAQQVAGASWEIPCVGGPSLGPHRRDSYVCPVRIRSTDFTPRPLAFCRRHDGACLPQTLFASRAMLQNNAAIFQIMKIR